MKGRKNPTDEQLLRRLRRHPVSERDPRYKNDAYWALRLQGHPHAYAKRAFRDTPPRITEEKVSKVLDCDPEDILFPENATFKKVEVETRPQLNAGTVLGAQPRASEYTIWDHKINGLGLRVRASGYKSFIVLKYTDGKKKLQKVTLGNARQITIDEARNLARQYLADTQANEKG